MHCIASCYTFLLPAALCMGCFLPCFSPLVASKHQTTEMVIYYYKDLPVNRLNCQYVFRETYNKVNIIYRLLSIVVVGNLTNVDDSFVFIPHVWCCVD